MIRIYRNDNYECIYFLDKCHEGIIYGLIEYNDNKIMSFSQNGTIKIWNLN